MVFLICTVLLVVKRSDLHRSLWIPLLEVLSSVLLRLPTLRKTNLLLDKREALVIHPILLPMCLVKRGSQCGNAKMTVV